MRKKLTVYLFSLLPVCCLNPVFSANTTNDTIIHFMPGTKQYDLVLEGREQTFVYDYIQSDANNTVQFRIKNNSNKTIVLKWVRSSSSGHMLADLMNPGINKEVKTGNSIDISIKPANRVGPFSVQAVIHYQKDGEEQEVRIRVNGFVKSKPGKEDVSNPEGLERFNIEKLVRREESKKEYSFTLREPPESDGFSSRPKRNVVFSWDTLRSGAFTPLTFRFTNTSKNILTILRTERKNDPVYYRNLEEQIVLLPDSSLTFFSHF